MPLNQQPKLQWSVPFPNGPVTISVMTKTTTPSADLMEAIVVIMTARVGITTVASVSALKCQQPLKNPFLTDFGIRIFVNDEHRSKKRS